MYTIATMSTGEMNDKVMTIRGNAHGRKDRHEPAKWRVCDYMNLQTPVGEMFMGLDCSRHMNNGENSNSLQALDFCGLSC